MKKLLIFVFILILICSALSVPAAAAGPVSIGISAPAQAGVGGSITVTFTVNNPTGQGLGALDFSLTLPEGLENVRYTAAAISGCVASYTDHFGFYSTDISVAGYTNSSWLALTLEATISAGASLGEKQITATITNAKGGDGRTPLSTTAVNTASFTVTHAQHSWDGGQQTKAPTCTEAGVRTFTCTTPGCGQTRTEAIPATGHKYDSKTEKVPATCTEAGYTKNTCSCGAVQKIPDPNDPAKGHMDTAIHTEVKGSKVINTVKCHVCGREDTVEYDIQPECSVSLFVIIVKGDKVDAAKQDLNGDDKVDLKDVTLLWQGANAKP